MQNLYISAEPVGSIPLAEVSGLALGRDPAGAPVLLAIGDRAATIATASLADGLDRLEWRTLDLRDAAGTRIPKRDPQLEALAADGSRGVLIVQEWPNRAEFFDADSHTVRAHLTLEVGEGLGRADLRRSWLDDSCSHAEGVALLRDGHLLVVKEKDPVALVEFGPVESAPAGFGPDRWLAIGEPWTAPAGEAVLSALAVWEPSGDLAGVCPDLSDAAVASNGDLVLVSDQGGAVIAVPPTAPAEDPARGFFDAVAAWHVSELEAKPEGIVVLPHGDVLIACDRKKVRTNLFLVRREVWESVTR